MAKILNVIPSLGFQDSLPVLTLEAMDDNRRCVDTGVMKLLSNENENLGYEGIFDQNPNRQILTCEGSLELNPYSRAARALILVGMNVERSHKLYQSFPETPRRLLAGNVSSVEILKTILFNLWQGNFSYKDKAQIPQENGIPPHTVGRFEDLLEPQMQIIVDHFVPVLPDHQENADPLGVLTLFFGYTQKRTEYTGDYLVQQVSERILKMNKEIEKNK